MVAEAWEQLVNAQGREKPRWVIVGKIRCDPGGPEKWVAEGRWGSPSRLKENEGQRWTVQCSLHVQEERGCWQLGSFWVDIWWDPTVKGQNRQKLSLQELRCQGRAAEAEAATAVWAPSWNQQNSNSAFWKQYDRHRKMAVGEKAWRNEKQLGPH